jgi:hypothetical protein
LSQQRHIIGVKAISSEGPEVSARETEADGVFDKLDVIKDKLVNLQGKTGKGESIVTTLGFRLPVVWWGAGGRLAVGFALHLSVHPGLQERVARGSLGGTTVVSEICWYRLGNLRLNRDGEEAYEHRG